MHLADPGGSAAVPAVSLRRVADELGVTAQDLVLAERGADVTGVVIAEPGDDLGDAAGALVLAVGSRGADAVAVVAAAAKAGASAVAVRLDAGTASATAPLRAATDGTGTGLLALSAAVRWDQVQATVRGLLAGARAAGPYRGGGGDLYSLAQTVATLTHGLVSIEDGAHQVMAYAGPADEADELRRRSILGRACPEEYLTLLRQWGVHRRIRAGDEVVEVAARPDQGVRRRLVIGIRAGSRPLGSIWVQEGAAPLAENAERALRGAARLAASQLVDHYYEGDAAARRLSRSDLAHGLLTGRFDAAALALHLGIPPSTAAAVVAVDLREDPAAGETAWQEARRAEAAEIIAVHAAAYRRHTLVAQACGQIYAMLPEPGPQPAGEEAGEAALVRWSADLVARLRRHTGTPVQAVLAGTAARLDDIPAVKLRGHHALQIMARAPDRAVHTHRGLTASLMVRDLLGLLAGHEEIRHPALTELTERDAAHGTRLADSLLHYLDAFGDVPKVAKALNVHPNTLRYRVRKAVALTGLDLDDPEHRLAAMLQLRLHRDGPGALDR
ncbi:PucR family transcriptional regulator [Streptomyces sp. NPDC050400]|uniref:PucR family transcriptional regulator n=1 Tax=Streptomyces sp. NPDC050400 TaxID=3365610 RepID=UPI0037997ABD